MEQFGQGGIAVAAVEIEAIVQTLVAFDQAQVRICSVALIGFDDLVATHQVKVQVATVSSGGGCQPHRVDIIRAFLVWLHRQAAACKG
jgi:hypothetical protein